MESDLERLRRATAHLDAPFAVVDVDALHANADDLVRRAGGTPIRVASKSVRARRLLTDVLARPGYRGVLAYTLPEALWLHEHGVDDLLVAYPTTDRRALRALASKPAASAAITLMVDSVGHLELIESLAGHATIGVCIDLDAGLHALGGRIRIGARRSPLHTPAQAAAFAREIQRRRHLRLVGVMAYEAQIAGVGDMPSGERLLDRARGGAIRAMQAISARELARRRRRAVEAVRAVAPGLDLVNGGGTGSLERTASEAAVTEVAAGSGLYGPGLFDTYRAFTPKPAALFALPVVRRPGPGVATLLGGGYVASGAAGRDRLPSVHLPSGLRLDPLEGAGEVQTPVLGPAADDLKLGDTVFLRHAKAGELCERFDVLHLVEGDRVVDSVPTYRGEGQTFL